MTKRGRYHHGGLKAALIEAAVTAAREGGEQAIKLTQLVSGIGVTPAAAYWHFPAGRSDLLVAVGTFGRRELADRMALRRGGVACSADSASTARRRFRACGQAYVEYVLEQPRLFQVALRHPRGRSPDADPLALIEDSVDELVAAGVLPARWRLSAVMTAWATVHGLAILMTEGPLRRLPDDQKCSTIDQTLDLVQGRLQRLPPEELT